MGLPAPSSGTRRFSAGVPSAAQGVTVGFLRAGLKHPHPQLMDTARLGTSRGARGEQSRNPDIPAEARMWECHLSQKAAAEQRSHARNVALGSRGSSGVRLKNRNGSAVQRRAAAGPAPLPRPAAAAETQRAGGGGCPGVPGEQ